MEINLFKEIFEELSIEKIGTESFLAALYRKQGKNAFKADELAQNGISNFIESCNEQINLSIKKNVPFIFSSISKSVVVYNKDYSLIKNIENKILTMDWKDFEDISGLILQYCFGATDVKVTQRSADGGVDFEGRLPFKTLDGNSTFGFIEVYGQSKRYSGNVGIYDVKSFVAFANSKKRNYVHPAQLFLFFTSSDYAANAMKEIEDNGFVALNGLQISTILFRFKKILIGKNLIIDRILS
jgi:hypothetical protein